MKHLISKSKYLSGLQCKKLFWHHFFAKDSFPPVDEATQAIFDQGHEIGKLAHTLFPSGEEVTNEYYDVAGAVRDTKNLMSLRKPVFEAAFMHKNIFARVDILDPAPGGAWDIVEVKSSASVKEVNLHDLSLQLYILEGCGIKIRKCILMHVNSSYVRKGKVDAKKLFTLSDETAEVKKLLKNVEENLTVMRETLEMKIAPDVAVGAHCSDPYECPLADACHKFLPKKHSVFTLYGGGKKAVELIQSGVLAIKKIPDDFKLNEKQRIQRDCVVSGKEFVDADAISAFLKKLKQPLYFLDFETLSAAIPLFDNSRPYQQIPFQFVVYVTNDLKKSPQEISFLFDGKEDPRPSLLKELKKALGSEGTILSYFASFEKQRIKEMSEDFPEYASWAKKVIDRIVDLHEPFKAFCYYHPDQEGSASLKAVLPVLTNISYDNLEVGDGGTASREYLRINFTEGVSEKERTKVRAQLETYCRQDTMGMLAILKELVKMSAGAGRVRLPRAGKPKQ